MMRHGEMGLMEDGMDLPTYLPLYYYYTYRNRITIKKERVVGYNKWNGSRLRLTVLSHHYPPQAQYTCERRATSQRWPSSHCPLTTSLLPTSLLPWFRSGSGYYGTVYFMSIVFCFCKMLVWLIMIKMDG